MCGTGRTQHVFRWSVGIVDPQEYMLTNNPQHCRIEFTDRHYTTDQTLCAESEPENFLTLAKSLGDLSAAGRCLEPSTLSYLVLALVFELIFTCVRDIAEHHILISVSSCRFRSMKTKDSKSHRPNLTASLCGSLKLVIFSHTHLLYSILKLLRTMCAHHM